MSGLLINKISILNYKNILDKTFNFDNKINCFVGNNGVGKTNILDSIYHLAIGKSSFSISNENNINHESEFMLLDGLFSINNKKENITCSLKRNETKVLKRNEKIYKKLSDHFGLIPVVLISPYDTNLIIEGSSERRKFMDSIISTYDKNYLQNIITHGKLIKQRNKILKYFNKSAKIDMDSILVYNDQIVKLSKPIHECRKNFVSEFVPLVIDKYNNISGKNEKVTLQYKSDLNENEIGDLLEKSFQKDMILQFTSCGIHKDDLIFKIDNNSIKRFGSQGQQKSFLISLRFAEFEFLKNSNDLAPILLMDDIFDKLDIQRVKNIVDLVNSSEFGQLFVSDTDKPRIEKVIKSLKNSSEIFEI
tara:strand:+ start:2650 stop:3738 length:1089 start_codon:yes stop_codon:yes gene_type:complete